MRSYWMPLILLTAVVLGGFFGYFASDTYINAVKPIGITFLNVVLTTVIPLVFFCVAAAMTKLQAQNGLRFIFVKYIAIFVILGILAALYMTSLILIFPLKSDINIPTIATMRTPEVSLLTQIPNLISVSHFSQLFSSDHLLALIIFAVLVGLAAKQVGAISFMRIIQDGEKVFIKMFSFIMYFAPLGFFAYFAGVVHELGPKMIEDYFQVGLLYYLGALGYFFVVYSALIYSLIGKQELLLFWKYGLIPAITAIGTCSSAASIPVNCEALKKMQVPDTMTETLVPLGTILHKQGSIMGGIVKISFLFVIFHLNFASLPIIIGAVLISLLVGTVMGAIPSGGMLGELLILNVYGFPKDTLFLIATISIIIDPPATLLNVMGNTVAGIIAKKLCYTQKAPICERSLD